MFVHVHSCSFTNLGAPAAVFMNKSCSFMFIHKGRVSNWPLRPTDRLHGLQNADEYTPVGGKSRAKGGRKAAKKKP